MVDVAFVCPWFGVFAGGAERAVRRLARELQRRGTAVEILTTCSDSLFGDWSRDGLPAGRGEHEGLPVHRFPLARGRLERYRRAVHGFATRGRVSREEMYDFFSCGISSDALVDHIGKLPATTHVVANPYFHALTYRSVVELPGRVHLLACFHDEPQFHWAPVADMIDRARSVVFLSEEEKRLAIGRRGRHAGRRLAESHVVGMGVELSPDEEALLSDPVERRAIVDALDLPQSYFVTVGRKDAGKGLPQLVAWYANAKKRRGSRLPPLVIVGDGDRGLVPDSPDFIDVGYLGESQKLAVMAEARATINLSPNESFSFVIMESWLCGTPVIVSAGCAVTTGHCHRSAGGLAISDEADFEAAVAALSVREYRDSLGISGREYVLEHYNWDVVTDRFARALVEPCAS